MNRFKSPTERKSSRVEFWKSYKLINWNPLASTISVWWDFKDLWFYVHHASVNPKPEEIAREIIRRAAKTALQQGVEEDHADKSHRTSEGLPDRYGFNPFESARTFIDWQQRTMYVEVDGQFVPRPLPPGIWRILSAVMEKEDDIPRGRSASPRSTQSIQVW